MHPDSREEWTHCACVSAQEREIAVIVRYIWRSVNLHCIISGRQNALGQLCAGDKDELSLSIQRHAWCTLTKALKHSVNNGSCCDILCVIGVFKWTLPSKETHTLYLHSKFPLYLIIYFMWMSCFFVVIQILAIVTVVNVRVLDCSFNSENLLQRIKQFAACWVITEGQCLKSLDLLALSTPLFAHLDRDTF